MMRPCHHPPTAPPTSEDPKKSSFSLKGKYQLPQAQSNPQPDNPTPSYYSSSSFSFSLPPPQENAISPATESSLAVSGMAAKSKSPVEVGARGTIGSLVLQEIEHFRKLDLGSQQSSRKPKVKVVVDGGGGFSASSSNPGCSLGFRSPAGRRKKKKKKKNKMKKSTGGSGGLFLPSICSAVEIAEDGWADRIPRTGYRNLKHEQKY